MKTSMTSTFNSISEEQFVSMQTARDAKLGMPKLILPAIEGNMRGGKRPPPRTVRGTI
jgi:hypothetical protein